MEDVKTIFEEIQQMKNYKEKTYNNWKFKGKFRIGWEETYSNNKENTNLYCEECEKEQVFSTTLENCILNTFYIKSNCLICGKTYISFFILWGEKDKYDFKILKCGATTDTSLFKFQNKYLKILINEELYTKALVAYQNNLYTGAYIYFRKLLENKINNILIELNIKLDTKQLRFEDKIQKITEMDIFDDDKTIYKQLYKNLSKAVHELSEEECEENFLLIKQIFEFAMEEIEIKKERKNKQKQMINKLSIINNTQTKNKKTT